MMRVVVKVGVRDEDIVVSISWRKLGLGIVVLSERSYSLVRLIR